MRRKLLPKVQASTLEGALKNMAGKGRHLIGAVPRGRRRRLFSSQREHPRPPRRSRAKGSILAGPRAIGDFLEGMRPGRDDNVPSMTASRRRGCAVRCVASVDSKTAGRSFAGLRMLIIGISQASGTAIVLDGR